MSRISEEKLEEYKNYLENLILEPKELEKLGEAIIGKLKEYFPKDSEYKCIELGAGIGATSKKIIKKLKGEFENIPDKHFRWYAVDIHADALEIFKNPSTLLQKFEKNETKHFENILEPGLKFESEERKFKIETAKIDVQNFEELKNKILNDQYHLLYAPAFFYHVTRWRGVYAQFMEKLKDNGLIVLSRIGGDWRIFFPIFGVLEQELRDEVKKNLYNEFKKFFLNSGISPLAVSNSDISPLLRLCNLELLEKRSIEKEFSLNDICAILTNRSFSFYKILELFKKLNSQDKKDKMDINDWGTFLSQIKKKFGGSLNNNKFVVTHIFYLFKIGRKG